MERAMESVVQLANRVGEHVVPGTGLTNTVVRRFCNEVCSSDFKGVYAVDRIPALRLAGMAKFHIIVNLGREELKEDGHFVVVSATPDRIYYLDPFGKRPPLKFGIQNFLELCDRPVTHNRQQIQSFESAYCGLFAILYAWWLDAGRPFRLYFSTTRLYNNDRRCVEYLRRMVREVYLRDK